MIRYPIEYAAFHAAALAVVSWLGLRRRYAAVQVDNLPDFLVLAAQVPPAASIALHRLPWFPTRRG